MKEGSTFFPDGEFLDFGQEEHLNQLSHCLSLLTPGEYKQKVSRKTDH